MNALFVTGNGGGQRPPGSSGGDEEDPPEDPPVAPAGKFAPQGKKPFKRTKKTKSPKSK